LEDFNSKDEVKEIKISRRQFLKILLCSAIVFIFGSLLFPLSYIRRRGEDPGPEPKPAPEPPSIGPVIPKIYGVLPVDSRSITVLGWRFKPEDTMVMHRISCRTVFRDANYLTYEVPSETIGGLKIMKVKQRHLF
jgi:hypothetical protein